MLENLGFGLRHSLQETAFCPIATLSVKIKLEFIEGITFLFINLAKQIRKMHNYGILHFTKKRLANSIYLNR